MPKCTRPMCKKYGNRLYISFYYRIKSKLSSTLLYNLRIIIEAYYSKDSHEAHDNVRKLYCLNPKHFNDSRELCANYGFLLYIKHWLTLYRNFPCDLLTCIVTGNGLYHDYTSKKTNISQQYQLLSLEI